MDRNLRHKGHTMFWNTLGLDYLVENEEFEKKLTNEDTTLENILDNVNCLQEIRSNNQKVLTFLKREGIFRELMEAILCPKHDDSPLVKEKYKFVHRCCEAISLASSEFYQELSKYDDLMKKLINFLSDQSGNLNHLVVSFYTKMVMCFLSAEWETFLTLLEQSDFLENCIESLEFCSIFELLCAIANCLPDPSYRNRVKHWYVSKGLVNRLLDALTPDKPSEIHENAAALWTEFVKALRDIQYNVEVFEDELLDSLQSESSVRQLLQQMFPEKEEEYCSSVVSNGCAILNALIETNFIKDCPSWLLQQEAQKGGGVETSLEDGRLDLTMCNASSTSTASFYVIDSKRVVESLCAEYSHCIMRVVIHSLDNCPDVISHEIPDDDVLIGCMQLLVNLLNTNFLPTHVELLKAFSDAETHFSHLVNYVRDTNALFSVFNSLLTTVILHILYSSTGAEKPLISFLLKDYNMPQVIRCAFDGLESRNMRKETASDESGLKQQSTSRIEHIARRTFFLQLANRLVQCQLHSHQGDYVESLLRNMPDYEEWSEFSSHVVESFADRNRSDKVLSTTTRSSNAIEIDEIKDIPFFMEANTSGGSNSSGGGAGDQQFDNSKEDIIEVASSFASLAISTTTTSSPITSFNFHEVGNHSPPSLSSLLSGLDSSPPHCDSSLSSSADNNNGNDALVVKPEKCVNGSSGDADNGEAIKCENIISSEEGAA